MGRHDAYESYLLPYNYLECPSRRYRQPYNIAPSGRSAFVQDAPDNFGRGFFFIEQNICFPDRHRAR
jgi:hypothetical protein